MKHVPRIFGLDDLGEFFMDEAALKQVSKGQLCLHHQC